MPCVSIDKLTSILTLNINVISLNAKSSIGKKNPTPRTKIIYFLVERDKDEYNRHNIPMSSRR